MSAAVEFIVGFILELLLELGTTVVFDKLCGLFAREPRLD